MYWTFEQFDGPARVVMFAWTGFIALVAMTGAVGRLLRPRWWGRAIDWIDVTMIVSIGVIPIIVNVVSDAP